MEELQSARQRALALAREAIDEAQGEKSGIREATIALLIDRLQGAPSLYSLAFRVAAAKFIEEALVARGNERKAQTYLEERDRQIAHSGTHVGDDQAVVRVRRQWNDSGRIATYRLESLSGVHWDDESGGVHAPAPQPFLHGYVWCDAMLEGELGHSCVHGTPPHQIKVCITQKDNTRKVFEYLKQQANSRQL